MVLSTVLCRVFVAFVLCIHQSFAKNRLNEALESVLGHLRIDTRAGATNALRIRCSDRAACMNPTPAVEADNVVFYNSIVHIDERSNQSQTEAVLSALQQYSGARGGHLPSSKVQIAEASMWKAGPRVNISSPFNRQCNWTTIPNTHAIFHFPWENNNVFHTLHDNVFSILTNVVVQYLSSPPPPRRASPQDTPYYELYLFSSIGRRFAGEPSLLNALLPVIFGDEHVHPTRALMKDGPHCVPHMSWTAAPKPYYIDSLGDLRRATLDVLQHIVRSYQAEHMPNTTNPIAARAPRVKTPKRSSWFASDAVTSEVGHLPPRPKRVIIVSRNDTRLDPKRRLHPDSEQQLMRAYEQAGFQVEICCDFKEVNTIPRLLEHFLDVDVCVGLHGAGLSNCVFGRPGMTVVELQTHHGFGVQSFLKLAHALGGDYIMHDIRGLWKGPKLSAQGIELSASFVRRIVEGVTLQPARAAPAPARKTAAPVIDSSHTWGRYFSSRTAPGATQTTAAAISAKTSTEPPVHYIVIDLERRLIGVHPPPPNASVAQTLPGYRNFTLTTSAALHSQNTTALRKSTQHLTYMSLFDRLNIARNNDIYWVAPSPTVMTPYTRESILGPRVEDVQAQCKELVYFELRQLLVPPTQRESQMCDAPPPPRKKEKGVEVMDSVMRNQFFK